MQCFLQNVVLCCFNMKPWTLNKYGLHPALDPNGEHQIDGQRDIQIRRQTVKQTNRQTNRHLCCFIRTNSVWCVFPSSIDYFIKFYFMLYHIKLCILESFLTVENDKTNKIKINYIKNNNVKKSVIRFFDRYQL